MGTILWPNGGTRRPNISVEGHFGYRNASTPGASKFHRGLDMWGLGIVRSIADGLVVHVGWGSLVGWGGGYQVWIQHDGFFTRSLHLRDGSATVQKGQRVKAGDPIGVEGHTGTYADHLHLEVTPGNWHTGNYGQVDPRAFIEARLITGSPANVPESNESEEDDMTPEQERKLNEIHDALFKDGKAPKDWSLQHKIDWLRRQFADASIDSPGGPQKRWSLPHILSWMGRVLNELGARTKRIETKLGITEKD